MELSTLPTELLRSILIACPNAEKLGCACKSLRSIWNDPHVRAAWLLQIPLCELDPQHDPNHMNPDTILYEIDGWNAQVPILDPFNHALLRMADSKSFFLYTYIVSFKFDLRS